MIWPAHIILSGKVISFFEAEAFWASNGASNSLVFGFISKVRGVLKLGSELEHRQGKGIISDRGKLAPSVHPTPLSNALVER